MDPSRYPDLEDLAASGGAPHAGLLTPEVRSGSSFTYSAAGGSADSPAFLVVWFYRIVGERSDFVNLVASYESSGNLPQGQTPPVAGLSYRGTYSVSISGAAPDFEFRTVWGLETLARLEALNDHLRNPPAQLADLLAQISTNPPMRSEIMGLTRNSASPFASAS